MSNLHIPNTLSNLEHSVCRPLLLVSSWSYHLLVQHLTQIFILLPAFVYGEPIRQGRAQQSANTFGKQSKVTYRLCKLEGKSPGIYNKVRTALQTFVLLLVTNTGPNFIAYVFPQSCIQASSNTVSIFSKKMFLVPPINTLKEKAQRTPVTPYNLTCT